MQTVDESGAIETQYDYDIFGNPTLTIEQYSSAIRYAGEFYLRARYYDPYVGRFISEDTYGGKANDPLSLNRYTYVHNNPLTYWDPTGHWEQDDINLNVEAQAKIIALTNAYFKAQTKEEKNAIHQMANDIRADESSKQSVVSPLKFQATTIEHLVSGAVSKRGYMTADEWQSTIKQVGISTKTNAISDTSNDSGDKYYFTSTTTVIGRTNLTVDSEYANGEYKKIEAIRNDYTGEFSHTVTTTKKVNESSASFKMSYNVNGNEAKFVSSMAAPGISLEQVLVLLDTLNGNNGKLTKKDLKDANVDYYAGLFGTSFGDNIDSIEMAYDFSNKGLTVAEAEMLYQQEVVSRNIQEAFGVMAFGLAGGGFKINSGRVVKPVTIPKGTGNLASKVEVNAGNQLAKMERGATGAHYYSRHGAQTTLDQQYTRATTGVTPDGFKGRAIDSSRFLSNQAQLNAAQRAETIYKQTGKNSFSFDVGEVIGEGYKKGGGELVRTSNVTAVFRNGKLYTLYPNLSPID